MLDILALIVVVIILLALFKGPLIWVLGLIQDVVFGVIWWYAQAYTLERIAITIIVLWLVKKLFRWLFK
ncbi:MAG: hypothetical protein IJO08_04960 [Clostridia bacterium]|nr:hypothetical protein [Clostridia bacterium]